jgi:uncharacterized protein (TIGR00730 family)
MTSEDNPGSDEAVDPEAPVEPVIPASEEERGVLEPLEPASRRAGGPVSRRIYTTGRADLDQQVVEMIGALSTELSSVQPASSADLELTREMLTSTVRLVLQRADRAELKMVNAALKEFAYSFRVFMPYRHLRKVSIFGSARVLPGDDLYLATREFAHAIAERGWMVITGAGPGIMAAGHEGAGAEHSFGANIRLPSLNPANIYIAKDGKLINFKYFFTRKVTFIKESSAFVLLPGGWGTMDEAFELLTLMQTGKSDLHPVVMLDPRGSDYWHKWLDFVHEQILARGFLLDSDLALFRIAETPEAAVDEIEHFYRNYQSARFVGDRLVLRVKREPGPERLDALNGEFADLLDHGAIQAIGPTSPELREGDALELRRIALYPKHAYGRIRQLIDALNEIDPDAPEGAQH